MNKISHHNHLDESTFIFKDIRKDFISSLDKIPLIKQNSPRWDDAFCSRISGAILFVYVPQIGHQACELTFEVGGKPGPNGQQQRWKLLLYFVYVFFVNY